MKFNALTEMSKYRARCRLRRMMRGYRTLKKEGRLPLFDSIRDELSRAPFARSRFKPSKLFFGSAYGSAEIAVRQYLIKRFAGLALNKALLRALGKRNSFVVYPLPSEWQKVMEKNGFRVAHIFCSFLWFGYIFCYLGYGVFAAMKQSWSSLSAGFCRERGYGKSYVYFFDLVSSNLPNPSSDGVSHDIISWYASWDGRAKGVTDFYHSVRGSKYCKAGNCSVLYARSILPPLVGVKKIAAFTIWVFAVSLYSFLNILCGRWWYALLFKEAALAAYAGFQPSEKLARDYMFHNSGWLYRPLWTYEAEKKGSRIIFYFYSTNCEDFKRPSGYVQDINCWHMTNWPVYLVWDKYQAEFIKRVAGAAVKVDTVGPIFFQTSQLEAPALPFNTVMIFDVQPRRDCQYRILGASLEYYIPEVVNRFLEDTYNALESKDFIMAHKRKRQVGKYLHPKYARFVRELAEKKGFISIDPDISAARLIGVSCAVISMPFTSTAILAKTMGKPSAYYDPTGMIQKDDRAAHGIPVLCGRDELNNWLANTVVLNGRTNHDKCPY